MNNKARKEPNVIFIFIFMFIITLYFYLVYRFQWHGMVLSVFVVFLRLCSNKSSCAFLCREYFCHTVAVELEMPFFKSPKRGP